MKTTTSMHCFLADHVDMYDILFRMPNIPKCLAADITFCKTT